MTLTIFFGSLGYKQQDMTKSSRKSLRKIITSLKKQIRSLKRAKKCKSPIRGKVKLVRTPDIQPMSTPSKDMALYKRFLSSPARKMRF